MLGFSRLFHPSRKAGVADALYRQVVRAARRPAFYVRCGVADTPDGRFDLIVLHAVLLLRRMRQDPAATAAVSQAVFDLMFADMDQNLREMGVGDLAVGKRVKKMAQGFYGRLAAYDKALREDDAAALNQALRRNLYRAMEPEEAQVRAMVAWMHQASRALDQQPLDRILDGTLTFPDVPDPAAPGATPGEGVTG